MDANRAAFSRWTIIPRMLQDNTVRDFNVALFGQKYSAPILVVPVGVNAIFYHVGESAVARAAARCNVPYIMSTASSTPPEEVGEASGPRAASWFQLYWPMNKVNDFTLSMLSRTKKAGFTTLVVTLELWALSWRPKGLDNAYAPSYLGIGDAIGHTDPVFQAKYMKDTELKFLKENWEGPIVLKGVQSVEHAELAVKAGVQGIVVSNHGGRQCDGATGSLTALPDAVKPVGHELTVSFDSGVRNGAHIMKALALGAKAVLIGRSIMYGLSVSEGQRAEHVMRCLLAINYQDLNLNMGLVGLKSISELTPKILRKENMPLDMEFDA